MAALPAFGMEGTSDNLCTQCHSKESIVRGIGHTTDLTALLSLQLPFKSARHGLCATCNDHTQNVNLSPLQQLGCKHCYMQKNPTYAGCSNTRYWSEIILITGVICYGAYKTYQWWKGEDAQEKNDSEQNLEKEKVKPVE